MIVVLEMRGMVFTFSRFPCFVARQNCISERLSDERTVWAERTSGDSRVTRASLASCLGAFVLWRRGHPLVMSDNQKTAKRLNDRDREQHAGQLFIKSKYKNCPESSGIFSRTLSSPDLHD